MARNKRIPLLLGLLGGGGAAASPLLTNLVAYWKLDETSDGSGAVTRLDSFGSNNLTDNNTTPSGTGVISNAAAFVGANTEYLSIAVSADLKGGDRDWAMDGWFKLTDRTVTQEVLSSGTSIASAAQYEIRLFVVSGDMSIRVSNGTTNASRIIGSISTNDTWAYFYIYHDSTSNVIGGALNNAALVSSGFTASDAHSPGGSFRLGVNPAAALPMTGSLDEVARWNRLLTETERLDRWNGGSGNAYPFS
jgi:hypothetical protein